MSTSRAERPTRGATLGRGKTPDLDVSVMDTEPLDVDEEGIDNSVLDTEPFQDDGNSTSDTEVESDNEEEVAEVEEDSDVLPMMSESCMDESLGAEDEDDTPMIDITLAPSHEVKRIYSDLMESCRGFEDSIPNYESEKILKDNITTGDSLFRQIETSLSQTMHDISSQKSDSESRSVSDILMACMHTKMCSTMLKHKVKGVGTVASSFKIEEFLDSLRQGAKDGQGGYSVSVVVRKLAFSAATVGCAAAQAPMMFGSFDKDDIGRLNKLPEPILPKEKKTRVNRKNEDDNQDVTQTEILNKDMETAAEDKTGTPEALAKSVLKSVRAKYKEGGQVPQSLVEIAHAESLPDFVSRVFGVAFLVRDGRLGVSQDAILGKENGATLKLKPENPPNKDLLKPDDNQRNQTIASFSAPFLKKLYSGTLDNN